MTAAGMLADRVVLITGAAAGLGRSTAHLAASEGARVVVADRDLAAAASVAAEIRAAAGEAQAVAVDVADEDQVIAMVAACVATYGRLDAAVNNAARVPDRGELVDLDMAAFDSVIAVNLRGVAVCMKHQARQFRSQGLEAAGQAPWSIVNVGSTSSVRPRMANPAYVAAKHGVLGLTKSGAIEMASLGVRVNAVLPGGMDTPMIRAARASMGLEVTDQEFELSLFGRLAAPREVAEAIVWLSSTRASYITGAQLAADAGYLAR